MTADELNKIDVSKVTAEDLEKIKNPVLKAGMIDALRRKLGQISADYTSHSQHTDHGNNVG